MLGVGEIDIGDDIDNPPVRLLRQALILAAVAGLHVEDGDVQPFRSDDRKARVRVAQHQNRVGLDGDHQLIAFGDDIAHRLTQVRAHGIHVHLRRSEFQVLEEHAVQVVAVVLSRVRQDCVEVRPALVDYRYQTDNLRPRSHNDEKFELAVVF